MRKMIKLLVLAVFMSGCAATVPNVKLDAVERQNIRVVAINENVTKKTELFYGGGMGAGVAFGLVGGLISGSINDKEGAIIKATVADNKLEIDKIVLEEMTTAFKQAGKFPTAAAGDKTATLMNIEIEQYGFQSADGLSDTLVPVISLKCTIQNGAGKVVWNVADNVGKGKDVKTVHLSEIKTNPALIAETWRNASKIVVAKILAEL